MRIAYFDEAGTSRREPVAVVGCVIVDADEQMIELETYLEALAVEFIPQEDRDGFIFHATDIWSGTEYFRDRDRWPKDRRLEILRRLAEIPAKFDLPLSLGFVEKDTFEPHPNVDLSADDRDILIHAVAFFECAAGVELFMHKATQNEIAMLIAENCDRVQRTVKEAHNFNRDPVRVKAAGFDARSYYPFRKIRDAVHFASKAESKLLQLADVCSFLFRGHLTKIDACEPFYQLLTSQMILLPKRDVKAA